MATTTFAETAGWSRDQQTSTDTRFIITLLLSRRVIKTKSFSDVTQNELPFRMAGMVGFEPTNADIKRPCLNRLTTSLR